MSTRGLSALQNEELGEGFSDSNSNNSDNDSRPAGRQGLERFHNSRACSDFLRGGFFLVKKPLGGCGHGYSNCGTAGAELGEEESWLRQEVELGFGFDLDSPA
jgi:hypothetical protein